MSPHVHGAAVLSSAVIFDDGEYTHSDDERVGGLLGFPECSSTQWSRIAFPALFEHQEQFLQLVKNKGNNNNNNKYTSLSI